MTIGHPIPDFLGLDQNGNELRRQDLAGKKVILYFYPKDSTPGCTAEACSFRDHYAELLSKGFHVIGVSPDSASSHLRFIAKQQLPFRLIADTDKRLAQAFGVWGEKKMYGRSYMGIFRTTFLINEDGIVEKVFTPKEINTKIHATQILNL